MQWYNLQLLAASFAENQLFKTEIRSLGFLICVKQEHLANVLWGVNKIKHVNSSTPALPLSCLTPPLPSHLPILLHPAPLPWIQSDSLVTDSWSAFDFRRRGSDFSREVIPSDKGEGTQSPGKWAESRPRKSGFREARAGTEQKRVQQICCVCITVRLKELFALNCHLNLLIQWRENKKGRREYYLLRTHCVPDTVVESIRQ